MRGGEMSAKLIIGIAMYLIVAVIITLVFAAFCNPDRF
jgi:hypothetical protein